MKARQPDLYAARQEAYKAYLLREWDGVTMQECEECHDAFPDALFPYTAASAHMTVIRRRRCIACRENKGFAARARDSTPKSDNAFDVTTRWITETSGLAFKDWRQAEHEAQCVLMRECVGLPHHAKLTDRHIPPQPTQAQRTRWNQRILNAVTQYVPTANDWRMWHVGSALSNSA